MIYICIILIVVFFIYLQLFCKLDKKMKNIVNILKIVSVVFLLELTVFNINSYRLLIGDYKEKSYSINEEAEGVLVKELTN